MSVGLVYLHGFVSSPQSQKAVMMGDYLRAHHGHIDYRVPALGDTPQQAYERASVALQDSLRRHDGAVALMGSSLGGFLATVLAEQHGLKAVLINPAVRPRLLAEHFLGRHVNPYTGSEFTLEDSDIAILEQVCPASLIAPQHYWALLQKGDETLDYRLALEFYGGAKLTVEEGGDHGFQGFERYLPAVVEFLGLLG